MTKEPNIQPVVAVDGGGTRCRLALFGSSQSLRVEVGSANIMSNFDRALHELTIGFATLAKEAGLTVQTLQSYPTYMGLAGATGNSIIARLKAALPIQNLRVEDDRKAALRGAIGRSDGAIAHCGTGSFLALQSRGKIRLAGGWGAVLGDVASGQWAGRRALSECLLAVDGLRPKGALFDAIFAQFTTPEDLVSFATHATPAELGKFAHHVTQCAQTGDSTARSILQTGASDIAETLTGMGWHSDVPICLTGGIGPIYADYMPEPFSNSLRPPQGQPLDGAHTLARDFQKELAA